MRGEKPDPLPPPPPPPAASESGPVPPPPPPQFLSNLLRFILTMKMKKVMASFSFREMDFRTRREKKKKKERGKMSDDASFRAQVQQVHTYL